MRYFNSLKYFILSIFLGMIPLTAFASHQGSSGGLGGVIQRITSLLNALIPFIITLAMVYFLWGVSQFILHGGDETKRSEGRQTMIYGIIALFVMVSVWGLVALLTNTFGLQSTVAPRAPGLPF